MSPQSNAFKGIALGLSGGGYRAAGFHLGTIRLLDRLGLRNKINALSTVSGGTIVGAAYALADAGNQSFSDFSTEFQRFLSEVNVVQSAIDRLTETRTINGTASTPSLIRAAAEVYDNGLFRGSTLKDLQDNKDAIPEIAFNATEFRGGRSFRFQRGITEQTYSGNTYLRIPLDSETNRSIRIADIVAASSCFPSAFEPLRFPSDFMWTQEHSTSAVREELGEEFATDVALMDGGIFDNQGGDSLLKILKRNNQEIDLAIFSDTDPAKGNYFEYPPENAGGLLTVRVAWWFLLFLLVLSLVSASMISLNLVWDRESMTFYELIFLNVVPLALALGVAASVLWCRDVAVKALQNLELKTEISLWGALRNQTVREAVSFGKARIRSLITMSSNIFLKRTRDLGYAVALSKKDVNQMAVTCAIYDLDRDVTFNDDWSPFISEAELKASSRLREMSRKASEYQTNLWFLSDDELNLENLVDCGEATLCRELIVFLLRQRLDALRDSASSSCELFLELKRLWKSLNTAETV